MESPLTDAVTALLADRIESFEQLETLLLLRQHRDQAWTPKSVGEKLGIAATTAAEALEHLCRKNLLDDRVDGEALRFRYAPATPDLDGAVSALARAYGERRLEVMTLVSANAVARVRTSATRMFADAFLIGRRKKDG